MSESDVSVLTALLLDLKKDLAAINAKLDTAMSRIQQTETDIQNLYQANSEIRVQVKACKEEESAKINALTALTAPAVEVAEDVKDAKKFGDKIKGFFASNWKVIAIFIVGAISTRFPEIGKFLGHLISLASGVPTVTP